MDLKTKYTVKGIGKETTIESKVNIFTTSDGSKIEKVEDKWDGKLPDSSIADVSSIFQLLNPFWWLNYYIGWAFWLWSFVWYTRAWLVSPVRFENAVLTLIFLVGLPKAELGHCTAYCFDPEECRRRGEEGALIVRR